jgi:DNA-binding Lrp family transcriptional regulator
MQIPDKEKDKKKQEMKDKILKILSVNGRASSNEIAVGIKMPKPSSYNLLNEVINEYDLHFVPEIDIRNIWKYEIIKLSKTHSKREMLHRTIEQLFELGFDEYFFFVKFIGRVPSDEEIKKAAKDSYVTQFISRLDGKQYDLVFYVVSKGFIHAEYNLVKFLKGLGKYNYSASMTKVTRDMGFFPLNNEIIDKFNIADNYKSILMSLNENGREQISELAKGSAEKRVKLIYAFDRLSRTDILPRITYYEGKPRSANMAMMTIKVINMPVFEKTRSRWFMTMLKDYENKPNEYIFVAEMTNPLGLIIFLNVERRERVKEIADRIRKDVSGIEINYSFVEGVIRGKFAIRNFDIRHSRMYEILESENLAPKVERGIKTLNPMALDVNPQEESPIL